MVVRVTSDPHICPRRRDRQRSDSRQRLGVRDSLTAAVDDDELTTTAALLPSQAELPATDVDQLILRNHPRHYRGGGRRRTARAGDRAASRGAAAPTSPALRSLRGAQITEAVPALEARSGVAPVDEVDADRMAGRALTESSASAESPWHESVRAVAAARRRLGTKALKAIGYAALAYLLIRLVPGLEHDIGTLGRVQWEWLAVVFALELVSEVGFVMSWRTVVDPEDALCCDGRGERVGTRLAWVQLGGGMLVPGGSLSSVGVGAWILHRFGMPNELIAERQFNLQFLNTAVDGLALIVFGLGLASGILPGSQNLALTLLPAIVAALALAAVLWIAARGPGYARATGAGHPKLAKAVSALSNAVEDTRTLLTHRNGLRSVLGAIVYLVFDVLVLWSAFVALNTHPQPTFGVVILAYIIGALGGSLPLPAGIGSVLGMVGMLALFGVAHGDAAVAVILYQAVGELVPLVGGAIAWLFLRVTLGSVGKPLRGPDGSGRLTWADQPHPRGDEAARGLGRESAGS